MSHYVTRDPTTVAVLLQNKHTKVLNSKAQMESNLSQVVVIVTVTHTKCHSYARDYAHGSSPVGKVDLGLTFLSGVGKHKEGTCTSVEAHDAAMRVRRHPVSFVSVCAAGP